MEAAEQIVPKRSLTVEEKRQSLYAALLRYSPEYGSLRERALERMVVGALLGSNSATPYKMGDIRKNLERTAHADLRIEVVQQALDRLVTQQVVIKTELRRKHAYHLSEDGARDLGKLIESASSLFDAVSERMLANTAHLLPFNIGSKICRSFICECFARFGRQIARTVTGGADRDDIAVTSQVGAAFSAAVAGAKISQEAAESLRIRCSNFLRSNDPVDERLKFALTQGYYIAQLFALEASKFNPLADEAFSGSIFYLDTNVLMPRLLSSEGVAQLFDEMLRVAKRIGIDLRVTRATLNEARRVAAERIAALKQILGANVPDALIEHTRDAFLQAYLAGQKRDPAYTPDALMIPFDNLSSFLAGVGVAVDDRIEDEIIGARDFSDVEKVLHSEAVATRRFPKSQPVIRHDVCHYAIVLDQRQAAPKTWFLTRDRSLVQAAASLSGNDLPFCFSIMGFLQSISPFLTTAKEEESLAEVFSSFLLDQVSIGEQVFDIQELRLIVEMHEDVLCTPVDKLIPAFDYAKSTVLQGAPYRANDVPKVALALKKFLSSSADEQRRALEVEKRRLEEIAKEHEAKMLQEQQRREEAERVSRKATEDNDALRQDRDHWRGEREREAAENKRHRATLGHLRQVGRITILVFGVAGAIALWYWAEKLAGLLARTMHLGHQKATIGVADAFGGLLLVSATVPVVRHLRWRVEIKVAVVTLIGAAAIWASGVLKDEVWSAWSSYVQIASTFSTILVLAIAERRRPAASDPD